MIRIAGRWNKWGKVTLQELRRRSEARAERDRKASLKRELLGPDEEKGEKK